MERRFLDKVIVVTGAAGGIGRAAAARFAAEGARLVLVDVNAGGLAETLAVVERAGGLGLVVEADVTRIGEVQRYVAATVERWGGIDGFFNNAGILGAVSPLVDYPESTFDRVLTVNVKSVWLGLKVVAPAMIARGGGAADPTRRPRDHHHPVREAPFHGRHDISPAAEAPRRRRAGWRRPPRGSAPHPPR